MAFNITIGPDPHDDSDTDSSGVQVGPFSDTSGDQVRHPEDRYTFSPTRSRARRAPSVGYSPGGSNHSHEDPYDQWASLPYPDELKNSLSRPRQRAVNRKQHTRRRRRSPTAPSAPSTESLSDNTDDPNSGQEEVKKKYRSNAPREDEDYSSESSRYIRMTRHPARRRATSNDFDDDLSTHQTVRSSASVVTAASSIAVKPTISEDLSREDRDTSAKLRFLQKKLDRRQLDLRSI